MIKAVISRTPLRPYHLRSRLRFLVGVLVGLVVITGAITVGIALASRRAIATAHRMEIASRIGELSTAELSGLAQAFDQMLDALGRAEAHLVASERLAAIGRLAAGVAACLRALARDRTGAVLHDTPRGAPASGWRSVTAS